MLQLLLSILAITETFLLLSGTTACGAAAKNVTAVLGQTVKLQCPKTLDQTVYRMYIQQEESENTVFVNGFDSEKPLTKYIIKEKYMNRTKVSKTDYSMELSNVSFSDQGNYRCVMFYRQTNATNRTEHHIHLSVTAKYNLPTLDVDCIQHDGKICQLSCWSSGGYPQEEVMWAGLDLQGISDVLNSSSRDPNTETWMIKQTISYICHQPIDVTCSIGGAVSNKTICVESVSFTPEVLIAITVLLVVVLLIIVILFKVFWRRRHRAVPSADPDDADNRRLPFTEHLRSEKPCEDFSSCPKETGPLAREGAPDHTLGSSCCLSCVAKGQNHSQAVEL